MSNFHTPSQTANHCVRYFSDYISMADDGRMSRSFHQQMQMVQIMAHVAGAIFRSTIFGLTLLKNRADFAPSLYLTRRVAFVYRLDLAIEAAILFMELQALHLLWLHGGFTTIVSTTSDLFARILISSQPTAEVLVGGNQQVSSVVPKWAIQCGVVGWKWASLPSQRVSSVGFVLLPSCLKRSRLHSSIRSFLLSRRPS